MRQPIQDLKGSFILAIPWISQHGPTAKHTADDCGPACIAMTVHYLTDETPTVDQVSLSGGIPAGAEWSSLRQLQRAARCFGVRAQFVRPMMQTHIKTQIQKGLPCVALVKYDELDPEQPPRAHFILLVGFTPKTVIYHDPNLAEDDGSFVEVPWTRFKRAHDTTSKTPGNTFNNHGIIFHA